MSPCSPVAKSFQRPVVRETPSEALRSSRHGARQTNHAPCRLPSGNQALHSASICVELKRSLMSLIDIDRKLTALPVGWKGWTPLEAMWFLGKPWTLPHFPVMLLLPLLKRAVKRTNTNAGRRKQNLQALTLAVVNAAQKTIAMETNRDRL